KNRAIPFSETLPRTPNSAAPGHSSLPSGSKSRSSPPVPCSSSSVGDVGFSGGTKICTNPRSSSGFIGLPSTNLWPLTSWPQLFQFRTSLLQPRGQFQRRAKVFDALIGRKARRICGDLKQHTAGFAEVNGMKILAVDDRRDIVLKFRQCTAPTHLLLAGRSSPRHVMHSSYGNSPRTPFRNTDQIDYGARCALCYRIAEAVSLLGNLRESERLGQQ